MSDAKQESVMPVISLTPMVAMPRSQTSALLAPPPAQPEAPAVSISFREGRYVSCVDGVTYFDLVFDLFCNEPCGTVVDATPDSPAVSGTVIRRIGVNNEAFAQELNKVVQTTFIEGQEKPKDEGLAKRMRELAGIPHRDNYV